MKQLKTLIYNIRRKKRNFIPGYNICYTKKHAIYFVTHYDEIFKFKFFKSPYFKNARLKVVRDRAYYNEPYVLIIEFRYRLFGKTLACSFFINEPNLEYEINIEIYNLFKNIIYKKDEVKLQELAIKWLKII